MDVRDLGDVRRCPLSTVDVDEEVAGDPEREEVDREPAHDLVRAQMDREERVDEREASSRKRGAEKPERPRVQLVGTEDAEEGAREHHPLEADVHDATSLREETAHRGESERGRVAEHRRRERRPDDDLVEVADARSRREVAEHDSEDADHYRSPAEPPYAAAEGADPDRDRDQADENRYDRITDRERRERDPEGRDADKDPQPRDGP